MNGTSSLDALAPVRRPLPIPMVHRTSATVVPFLVFMLGTVGAWLVAWPLGVPVLGALVAVATLLATAFCRVWLKG